MGSNILYFSKSMEQNNQTKSGNDILATLKSRKWILPVLAIFILAGLGIGGYYLYENSIRIYIENSDISAPLIDLAPQTPGVLKEVLVQVGDQVSGNTVVAKIGDELVKTKTSGEIASTKNDIGKLFNSGEPVVSMVDPQSLRVVGRIEENKGLSDIKIGQRVVFTVDAFGSKEYYGTVDEISPTARQSGVDFNISDKRAVQEFEVKVRFNINRYSELKNGMSAKMRVYKN